MQRILSRLVLATVTGALCSVAAPSAVTPPPDETFGRPADLAALLGVAANRTILEDIVGAPLSTEALGRQPENSLAGGFTMFALAVECALTDEQSVSVTIEGEERTITGRYRMAPQWATSACDENCQEWVTSCMLAKINGYGVPVRIFLNTRVDHPDRPGLERPEVYGYPTQEGAFFGNFFTSPALIYTCRGEGRDPLYDTFRVCTHPGSPCKIQSVGPCLGDADTPHACEELDEHGVFRRCHNRLTLPGTNTFPPDSRSYDRLVTVHLPQSALSPGLTADTCFDGVAPDTYVTREPRADVGQVGDECETDDDCNEPSFYCYHLGGPGICTRGCTNSNDADDEAEMCGDDGTLCMRTLDDFDLCAQACRADIAGGRACPQGQVCTAYHLFSDFDFEDTGCAPFCQTDDDCPGTFCAPRTGACQLERPTEDGLPDGEPCVSLTRVCRGFCVPQHGYDGICGSYLNYAETRDCPDPDISGIVASDDDLALCVFRNCTEDADCTEPLVCDRSSCVYP